MKPGSAWGEPSNLRRATKRNLMRGAQAAQPWNGEQWMHYAARRQVSCSHTTPEPRDPRWRWTATNRRPLFFSPPAIAYPHICTRRPLPWQAGPGSHVATREKARECDGWPRRSQGPKEQTGFSRAHPHRGGEGGRQAPSGSPVHSRYATGQLLTRFLWYPHLKCAQIYMTSWIIVVRIIHKQTLRFMMSSFEYTTTPPYFL